MNSDGKNADLVKKLKREGRIKSKDVEKAFLEVNREIFIPRFQKKLAFVDTPLQIGEGQTISAPHMVAIMCEELDIKKSQNILEIGLGSGYHAAIVSRLVGKKGHVYSIERYKSLFKKAKDNLKNAGIKNVTTVYGDGSNGLAEYAPYDRIYLTCAAPDIPPPLIKQLKEPGKLIIPVGKMICELVLVEKNKKEIKTKNLGGCAFVPLLGKHGHK